MKRAPLLVLAGAVAGFPGVLGFHTRPTALAAPATASGTGSQHPAAPAAPAVPAVQAGPGAVRSAVGVSEQFGYGVLDVKVTVSGSRITDVSVPSLQVAEPTSQQICDEAIPLLRSEALAAQSGRIDGVSGATYTSEAYALSLQAALDALHLK
jgi:uncharacterized protein with FMN-binding domain